MSDSQVRPLTPQALPSTSLPCTPATLYRVGWQSKIDSREGVGLWTRERPLAESIREIHQDDDTNFDYWIEETTERVPFDSMMRGEV